jgi:hypothetical protein
MRAASCGGTVIEDREMQSTATRTPNKATPMSLTPAVQGALCSGRDSPARPPRSAIVKGVRWRRRVAMALQGESRPLFGARWTTRDKDMRAASCGGTVIEDREMQSTATRTPNKATPKSLTPAVQGALCSGRYCPARPPSKPTRARCPRTDGEGKMPAHRWRGQDAPGPSWRGQDAPGPMINRSTCADCAPG